MNKIFLLLLFSYIAYPAFSQDDYINVTDLLKIKQAGSIALSSDGSSAAFTVTATEPEENKTDHKSISQVYMVSTEEKSQLKQLTFSKEGASQPAWSPDGKK